MAGEDELFQMELNLHPNEASGLLMIGDEELLGEHSWDLGFWACLDEGEIEDCVAAIGHRRGYPDEEGWEIINDALKESGPALIPLGVQSHKALIAATIKRGKKENKKWAGLVREDDYPINIEGAAFREHGTLLLSLRFPTTAQGRPILVELEGIARLFDPHGTLPEVRGFWTVDAVGKDGEIAGVRDLDLRPTARRGHIRYTRRPHLLRYGRGRRRASAPYSTPGGLKLYSRRGIEDTYSEAASSRISSAWVSGETSG